MQAPGEPSPVSFFVTGGTLSTSASSYIVRRADTDLFQSLLAGEFCYVLNSRQMGKSSLMVRTAERLKAEGVTVAVLDLTSIGQNLTPEQWYDGLLVGLGKQIGLEDDLDDFYQERRNLSPLQQKGVAEAATRAATSSASAAARSASASQVDRTNALRRRADLSQEPIAARGGE